MSNDRLFISEAEAVMADEERAIQSLRIEKHGAEYTVHLQLSWRKAEVFIATQRDKTKPKGFMHLGRLIDFIETKLPRVKSVQLSLGHVPKPPKTPPTPRQRASKATAKARRG